MIDHSFETEQTCPVCNTLGRFAYVGEDLLMGIPGEYRYNECMACNTVYQVPVPDPQMIGTFYPDEYEAFRPGKIKNPNPLKKSVLRATYNYQHLESILPDWLGRLASTFAYRDSIPYIANGRLLDIGCGGGKFLKSMQCLGWELEGVEFNEIAVQSCRESGLKVFLGELSNAAFPDNSFDVVTARHVIEHIPTPAEFVTEIFRILKPGGLMLLETPNSRALGRSWFGTNWYANDIPRHLVLFAPKSLSLLAAKLEFRKQIMKTLSSPKIILNSWDYQFGNKGVPSKNKKFRRLIARLYVAAAALSGRGDVIYSTFKKP